MTTRLEIRVFSVLSLLNNRSNLMYKLFTLGHVIRYPDSLAHLKVHIVSVILSIYDLIPFDL